MKEGMSLISLFYRLNEEKKEEERYLFSSSSKVYESNSETHRLLVVGLQFADFKTMGSSLLTSWFQMLLAVFVFSFFSLSFFAIAVL